MKSPAHHLNVLVGVIVFISVFAIACQTPLDPDMWWHLRSGEETLRTGRVLTSDIFSFTRSGSSWVNVFWLSDLAMAGVFTVGGFLGLAALVAVIVTVTIVIVYLRMDGSPFLRAFIAILAAATAAPTWTTRPQIVSFLLIAVLDAWLFGYKLGRFRRLWLLPVLFVLWVNLHGGYIWGWLLLLAVLVGEAVNHFLVLSNEPCLSWASWRRLGFWSLLTVPAVLLNPSGLDAWRLPFQQVSVSLEYIHEWFSPDFHNIAFHPLAWMLFAILAAVGLSGRLMSAADFLKVAGFSYMAFYAQRNLGPMAVIAAPVLAQYLSFALDAWGVRAAPYLERLRSRFASAPANRPINPRIANILNGIIVVLLGIAALARLWLVASPIQIEAFLPASYPQQAVRWIQAEQPRGRLFNSYNWGGYLIWELRDYSVFIDGRADLYGEEIINQWFLITGAKPGWQELLDQWQINLILLEPGQPVVKVLPEEGWKLLYQDELAVVYGR